MDTLLDETLKFFLRIVISELQQEIDWRAKGQDKNVVQRAGIYLAAFARDLVRIPLHHRGGIGQARFRARIEFVSANALPVLRFFRSKYPIDHRQSALIEEAIELLQKSLGLIRDGTLPELDEWYATMDEFSELTQYSQLAAKKLEEAIGTNL